jgi:SAM-dependent methyltransferase
VQRPARVCEPPGHGGPEPAQVTRSPRHSGRRLGGPLDSWKTYLDRYRHGECRDRIFHDLVLEDARRLGKGLTFLDIGCGRGFDGDVPLQQAVARAAGRYIGIEPDVTVAPGAYFTEVHRCLFEDAPLPPNSADVAFAIMVLEHLERPERFWDRLWAVLREGGVFWALTVDARHWFCQASRWADRLRIKDYYLNALFGTRGVERYENYPVHYRTNTPRQIRRYAARFQACQFLNFSRVGQCSYYLPRSLQPLMDALERRAIRRGKPGTLLAVRAVK